MFRVKEREKDLAEVEANSCLVLKVLERVRVIVRIQNSEPPREQMRGCLDPRHSPCWHIAPM
jgi:hypothetical protein